MRKLLTVSILTVTFSFLTGCASIVNGTNQSVSVKTAPAQGAMCSLENDKGKWYVNQTPGSVTVHRSYKDLVVNCQKQGYQSSQTKVTSKTKGMAFGNILFGGVIGAGVDMADGSAYDYPTDIQIPMKRG
jgi:uncharacterized protein YceK